MDRNSKEGGKLLYKKEGIIAKRLENLETNFCGTIFIELFRRKNSVLHLHIGPKNKIRLYFLKRYKHSYCK